MSITSQETVKLFELSSLSLPAHPSVFSRIPLATSMKQVEPRRRFLAVTAVEFINSGFRVADQACVVRLFFRVSIAKIAQQGEIDLWILVSEEVDLELCEQCVNL